MVRATTRQRRRYCTAGICITVARYFAYAAALRIISLTLFRLVFRTISRDGDVKF